jgi:hypothetical protein
LISAADVINPLKADLSAAGLAACKGAGAIPQTLDQVKVSRTAFVMTPGERAHPNDAGTAVLRQTCTVDFQILVVFTKIGATGADQTDAIDAAREGIKNVLLGKVLAPGHDPVELVSAGILEVDAAAGTLVYALVFSTVYHLRRNA